MTRLIRSEAFKLRSVRTFYALTLGALVIIAIGTVALAAAAHFSLGTQPVRQILAVAGVAQTFALILGVLAVTGEFRHGTITAAVLITPKRVPLLLAKVVTMLAAGLIFGLIAFGGAVSILLPIMSARGVPTHMSGGAIVAIVAGGTVATALFGALGVGIGSILRNQVGSIIAALAILYAIEPILTVLPGVGNGVQTYGFGGLSSATSGTTPLHSTAHILSQVPAGLVLTGYAAVFLLIGAVLLQRRDIAE